MVKKKPTKHSKQHPWSLSSMSLYSETTTFSFFVFSLGYVTLMYLNNMPVFLVLIFWFQSLLIYPILDDDDFSLVLIPTLLSTCILYFFPIFLA